MRETVTLIGMVLISTPPGDYNKRLVLLTKEQGRTTTFSHGARKPGNTLMAVSRPLSFGTFSVYEGRSTYNLQSAQITNYLDELSMDMEYICYGFYFLEITDYFSQENMNGTEVLKLLYQSLRTLLKPAVPNHLVRRIFELKTMVISREYIETPPSLIPEFCNYTWEYVARPPMETLYKFVLKEDMARELGGTVDKNRRYYMYYEFKSLEILDMLTAQSPC